MPFSSVHALHYLHGSTVQYAHETTPRGAALEWRFEVATGRHLQELNHAALLAAAAPQASHREIITRAWHGICRRETRLGAGSHGHSGEVPQRLKLSNDTYLPTYASMHPQPIFFPIGLLFRGSTHPPGMKHRHGSREGDPGGGWTRALGSAPSRWPLLLATYVISRTVSATSCAHGNTEHEDAVLCLTGLLCVEIRSRLGSNPIGMGHHPTITHLSLEPWAEGDLAPHRAPSTVENFMSDGPAITFM